MKLFTMLLVTGVLQLSANVKGQNASVNLSLHDANLIEFFYEISKQTDYEFLYNHDLILNKESISIEVNQANVKELLAVILNKCDLDYQLEDSVIIIAEKEYVAPVVESIPVVQVKTLKGKVTDKDGFPLPGVSVVIKGTSIGVATDINGFYEIEIEKDNVTLIFSFVGMSTKEIDYSGQTEQNVSLFANLEQMKEVVITGYQTITKERSAGSFLRISQKELDRRPTSSITQRLEGAAGVNKRGNSVEIRGVSSIYVSTRPLFVVDGFPIEGDLSTINPEDVESIDVLKDATAASIWGVRASNGVVVITTKKGERKEGLSINLSSHIGITEKPDFSKMKLMNASESIDMVLEYIDKGWYNYGNMLSRGNSGLSLVDEAQIYLRGLAPDGNVWSQEQYDAYIDDLRTRNPLKQWEQYLYRRAISSNYNLSLSGGNQNNSFYGSVVYNNNKSHEIGNSNDQFILKFNDSYHFNDRLTFNSCINAFLSKTKRNGVSRSAIKTSLAWDDLVDKNGVPIQYYRYYNKWLSQPREALNDIPYTFNILEEQQNSDNTSENLNIRANFGLRYEIIEDLILSSDFHYEKEKEKHDVFESMKLPSHRELIQTMYLGGDNYQVPRGAAYKYTRKEGYSWSFRNTIAWDKNWNKHNLNVFAGMERRLVYNEEFSDRKYGYNKQTTTYIPVDEQKLKSRTTRDWRRRIPSYFKSSFKSSSFYNNSNSDEREVSVFSNLAYDFDEKYIVNASFRIDQKNLFGSDPDFRYKPLWSLGIGWNMSKEDFMSSIEVINRLKLRVTYGLGGNADNQSSPYAKAMNKIMRWGSKNFDFLRFDSPANNKLKWEETSVVNFAVDFALFNHKLNGSIEYYSKNSKDLLGIRKLDPTKGFSSAKINYASMTNKGFEITINASISKQEDFNWSVKTSFSYNSNKVSEIEEQLTAVGVIVKFGGLKVGDPLDNIYSYNYAGLNSYGNILLYNLDGTTKSWTEGVTDPKELIYHGTKRAPYYGGLSNYFDYKGFELCVNLAFKFGHKFEPSYGSNRVQDRWVNKYWLDRWKKPGDELVTRVPKIPYNGINPYSGEVESKYDAIAQEQLINHIQDYVFSAAHVRVRNIILSYNLPDELLKKTFIKNLKVTTQVTNPFLWVANSEGIDPEVGFSATAGAKEFTFGLKASF